MTMHYTHLGNADLLRSADSLPALSLESSTVEAGEIIDVTPPDDQTERDRAELRALADTLPPDQIREILNHYKR